MVYTWQSGDAGGVWEYSGDDGDVSTGKGRSCGNAEAERDDTRLTGRSFMWRVEMALAQQRYSAEEGSREGTNVG